MLLLCFMKVYLFCINAFTSYALKNTLYSTGHGTNNNRPLGFINRNYNSRFAVPVAKTNLGFASAELKPLDSSRFGVISTTNIDGRGVGYLEAKGDSFSWLTVNDSVSCGIRLKTRGQHVARLEILPKLIKKLAISKVCLSGALGYLSGICRGWLTTISSPGAYLEKQCFKCMKYMEGSLRQLSKEAHCVYLNLQKLGIYGLLKFSDNPVEALARIIGLFYLVEWFTNSGYLKIHYDLNTTEIFTKGQYYRLFTSLFLHNGVIHTIQNLRSLWTFGSEALTLLGPRRMLAVYLVSGVLANYLSYVYHFAYRNGLPSDAYDMAQSVVQGVGQSGMSTSNVVEHVMERIRYTQKRMNFPIFLIKYLHTSLFHILSGGIRRLLSIKPRQLKSNPDIDGPLQSYFRNKLAKQRGCGASSAIYGLMGAVCAYHMRFGDKIEKARVLQIVSTALTQNLMVFAGSNVDHLAHLFGFLSGFAMTMNM